MTKGPHASHCSAATKITAAAKTWTPSSERKLISYLSYLTTQLWNFHVLPVKCCLTRSFRWEIHTPRATLALSSSHFEAVTAQHLLLPLTVSWMWILETSGANLNLIVSEYASVSVLLPHNPFVRIPLTWNIKPITVMNYTATLDMCLTWPL